MIDEYNISLLFTYQQMSFYSSLIHMPVQYYHLILVFIALTDQIRSLRLWLRCIRFNSFFFSEFLLDITLLWMRVCHLGDEWINFLTENWKSLYAFIVIYVIYIRITGREFNIWLHIDAAYAGSAFICPEFRHLLNGVEVYMYFVTAK